MMHPTAILDQQLPNYLPDNFQLKPDDPRALESLLGLSAESVHPENVPNAATVDRLVDSLPQSLVEARGGVSGGLPPPPPPPPPPQQVAISSASPQPAQTPILLTASHVLDGQQGLTFTVAPHGVHQHHLVSSGGGVASSGGHTAPAGTQFVAFQSPLSFAPAGFVAIGGGGPAGGGTGGSPAAPVAPSSPSPVQSPYHLQTHSPLAQHASSLPRSSPAPPPLTPSPSPSPSSSAAIPSVAQAQVGSSSVSAPVSAPTTLHHLRPNTPIQVQLPANAFPLLQLLQQSGASGGTVAGSPFRANAGTSAPQQHIHPQPPPPPPRPKQPQLLPKPASGAPPPVNVSNSSIAVSSSSTCIASPAVQSVVSTVASSGPGAVGPHGAQLVIGQNHHHHHHHSSAGTLVLNQMIPGLSQSPVIIQQPGGGVQFILRQQQQQQQLVGGPAGTSAAGGVLTNQGMVGGAKGVSGGLVLTGAQGQVLIHHPQHQQLQQQPQSRQLGGTAGAGMAVQAGATGGQVVRFITTTQGPMQLQQIQTPSGPTLIAVPPGQTLSFQQIRGATNSGSMVPGAVIQGHAQIIQGPPTQALQGHILQPQQQQSLVHGGLTNQVRGVGPAGTMLQNHNTVNMMDSVGVVQRTRTMNANINPISVISPPPSITFPPPQPRKRPKKKKKRKGSHEDEEDGEGSMGGDMEEGGEEICGGVPVKTLNLADIMKSAGIGDDEDLGPYETGMVDGGEEGSLVQASHTVATSQTNVIQQQNSSVGSVGVSQDICTTSGLQPQTIVSSEVMSSHPGLNAGTNHQQTHTVHPTPQQSHLLAQLQGSLAVQQGQGQVRFAFSEDGRVLFQRDCSPAMQPLSPQTQTSLVSSCTPTIQSPAVIVQQHSVAAPRAHLAPPVPQPVSQLLSTSANTPSGNIISGGVGGGSSSGGSPSTGSPAPNNHVVLSQLLSHGGCGTNVTGDAALPTLPVGTQLGGGTPTNPNLRNLQNCNQQPTVQATHQENQLHSPLQLPTSPQYHKSNPQSVHQQQPLQQVHHPPPPTPPAPPAPQHKLSPPQRETPPRPQTSHQRNQRASSPPEPSSPDRNNHQSNNTVNIGGLVLTQQQQALLHQIKMSDLVAAGAASGLGAKSLTEALIQALSAVASNISMGGSPTSSTSDSNTQMKGNAKFSKGKSPPGPPTSTQLLLQQLGAAVAAAARKVIPAGAVVEPGLSQEVRRPSPPVARKRRKKATEIVNPTTINSPRLQGCGTLQNDVARAAARLCHVPNSPRTTAPMGAGPQSTSVNTFSAPIPAITESRLSSPIVPAPPLIPNDNQSTHSNSCEPITSSSQEPRFNQINTTVSMCQQSPPHLVPLSSSASSSPSTTSLTPTLTSSSVIDSKVLPVSSSSASPSGLVVGGQSGVIQRVQTIQLTTQKQQQLREVQQQLQVLTSRKGQRSAQDNAAIQHLYFQQQRILLTGKIVPTIPGQHAQGVQFNPMSPTSSSETSTSPNTGLSGNCSGGKGFKAASSQSTCLANLLRQPVSSSSPQSPTIRYYHQVGNQIIPLAPQQAVTSTSSQQHAGGGSKSSSSEVRPIKSNVGPNGSIPSPQPPSPTTTVHSPCVTSASPVVSDSTPMTTCHSDPNSPMTSNNVVGGSINVQGPQRELYVCIGGNNVSAEDEGESSSVESALTKQIQGGTSVASEEQNIGHQSPCSISPSKNSISTSIPQSSVSQTQTSIATSCVSTASVQSSNSQMNRTCNESVQTNGMASGEDTVMQPMDSSADSTSPHAGVKRPALSPVRPTINKVSLIEQQLRTDQAGALNPDVHTPFTGRADACKRLVRYHVLNERVLSARDLDKADEIFEATARHLLDKFSQMTAKYRYLLLMESMKEVRTSELMMIDRMFVAEEQLALERLKEEARLAEELEEKKKKEAESKPDEDAVMADAPNSSAASLSNPVANGDAALKEVRISLHDVLKSESIKKEAEEGRYTIVRNSSTPTVKEEEDHIKDEMEEEKPYDEWEAIQKELSVYCGVKREEGNEDLEHPPNGEPGARRVPAAIVVGGEESSCDASRSPGLVGPAPPLDDPGGGAVGDNSNLCEDDDINAQVQSAIDSILNLQRAEDEGLGLEDVFDVTLEEEEEGGERRTVERSESDVQDGGSQQEMACDEEEEDEEEEEEEEDEEEVGVENTEEGVVNTLSKEVGGGGDLALDEAVRSILSS